MVPLDYGHRQSAFRRLKPYLHRWWSYVLVLAIFVISLSPWLYQRAYLGNRTIDLCGRVVDVNRQPLAGATVNIRVARLDSYILWNNSFLIPYRWTESNYRVATDSDGRFELHGAYGRRVAINGIKVSARGYYAIQPVDKPPYTGPDLDYGSFVMKLPTTRSREVTIVAREDQRYYFP